MPWRRGLRFYAQGDIPPIAIARAERAGKSVKEEVLAAIQDNMDDLAGLTLAGRVDVLASVLPYLARETIRSYCARNLARR